MRESFERMKCKVMENTQIRLKTMNILDPSKVA